MASTYNRWRSAYVTAATGDPKLQAKLIILEREHRVPTARTTFEVGLVAAFDGALASGASPGDAAIEALAVAVRGIRADARLVFLLPVSGPAFDRSRTHVTARYLSRLGTFGDVDSDSRSPARLPVSSDEVYGPEKTAVWLTPDDCPRTPDDVAKVLGLPHFEGQIAYRMDLAVRGIPQFTPSCFDAALFEAWQETPVGHAGTCGLCRHLETGARTHNEFVVNIADVRPRSVELVRLPAPGPAARVGTLRPDYLVSR